MRRVDWRNHPPRTRARALYATTSLALQNGPIKWSLRTWCDPQDRRRGFFCFSPYRGQGGITMTVLFEGRQSSVDRWARFRTRNDRPRGRPQRSSYAERSSAAPHAPRPDSGRLHRDAFTCSGESPNRVNREWVALSFESFCRGVRNAACLRRAGVRFFTQHAAPSRETPCSPRSVWQPCHETRNHPIG
jgi:hypothetical protein